MYVYAPVFYLLNYPPKLLENKKLLFIKPERMLSSMRSTNIVIILIIGMEVSTFSFWLSFWLIFFLF